MITALLALAACSVGEQPVVSSPNIELQQVELEVGAGVHATLHTAYLDPDGASGGGEQVVATVEGREPLVITGERSTWDLASGQVVFEGAVKAVRDDLTLRCEELTAQFDGDRITSVRATGGVRATRGARMVTAQRGVLEVHTGALVLTGEPLVSEGDRRLSGQRVVIYLDDERLVCDGCRLEVPGAWLKR